MSHTPGPWEALPPETSHAHYRVVRHRTAGINEHRIALSCCKADARLIAAAPELLEALELFAKLAEAQDLLMPLHQQKQVRDAIAKARGEA